MGGCPLIWGSLGLYFRVFSQPRRSRGFHDIDRRLRCSYNESADTSYAKCVDNDGSLMSCSNRRDTCFSPRFAA
jgi:hypothetical protein